MKLNGSLSDRIDAIISKARADVGRKYIEHAILIYKDAGYVFNDAILNFCRNNCNMFKDTQLFFENQDDNKRFVYDLFADSEAAEWVVVPMIIDAAKLVADNPVFSKTIPLGRIGFRDARFYIDEDGQIYGLYPDGTYRFQSLASILGYEFGEHVPIEIDYLEEKHFDDKKYTGEEEPVEQPAKEFVLRHDDFVLAMKFDDDYEDNKIVKLKVEMDGYRCLNVIVADEKTIKDFAGSLYYACRSLTGKIRLGSANNFIEFIFEHNQTVAVRGHMYMEGAFKKEFVFVGEVGLSYVDDFADQLFGDELFIF